MHELNLNEYEQPTNGMNNSSPGLNLANYFWNESYKKIDQFTTEKNKNLTVSGLTFLNKNKNVAKIHTTRNLWRCWKPKGDISSQ